MFFLELLVVILSVVFIISVVSVVVGVPFLPTHRKQAIKMIELAGIKPGAKVVDLGSGAGRLLFLAAAKGAVATGYELNPFLVWWTRLAARLKKFSNVSVRQQSLYTANLKDVDVVFAFLFPEPMKKLSPKLFSELKPGAKIISYTFSIPGKTPILQTEGIFVYQV